MRGFFRVAALLASNAASGLVIPNAEALDGPPAESIVQYDPSGPKLAFVINSVEPVWTYPTHIFEVEPSTRICAESNIKLNGQQLETIWDGIQGHGQGTLSAYGGARYSWTIACLWDSSKGDTEDVTHILIATLLDGGNRASIPAFTISFKSYGSPSIYRFEPHYSIPPTSNSDYADWRYPSSSFIAGSTEQGQPTTSESPANLDGVPLWAGSSSSPESGVSHQVSPPSEPVEQKTLSAQLEVVEDKVKDTWHKITEKLKNIKPCPRACLEALMGKPSQESASPTKAQDDDDDDDDDDFMHDELDSTPTRLPPAAETRSIHLETTSTGTITYADEPNGIPSAVVLKSFFLSLTVLSLLTWIICRCRDPRRRADRAFKREERRTKRLYQQAARKQAFKNWVWNTRVRYGLLSRHQQQEEEKQRRVSEQDAFLEDVMKDDIRSFRRTHGAVSRMTGTHIAAEEGRSGFSFGQEVERTVGHQRVRRVGSVSTLPGYDSEGTQPPAYDENGRRASVTEFTSDSSVISTSPRISRDGTNSDLDEKIEEMDLNAGGVGDFRTVNI